MPERRFSVPIRYDAGARVRVIGTVEDERSPSGVTVRVFNVRRKGTHVFANVPCQEHTRCPGLTIWKEGVRRALHYGAKVIRFTVDSEAGREHYIISMDSFLSHRLLGENLDDMNEVQYTLPLHAFVRVERPEDRLKHPDHRLQRVDVEVE